jgi:hypothetical protein
LYDDPEVLWNLHTVEVLAFKIRTNRPKTVSQWKMLAKQLNSICRSSMRRMFSRSEELDSCNGWDQIMPLNTEPTILCPAKKVALRSTTTNSELVEKNSG